MHDDTEGKKGKSPKKPEGKLVACGNCEGCNTKACKKCDKCLSKPKKRCALRKCTDMRRVPAKDDTKKKKKKRGRPKKEETVDEDSDDGDGSADGKPKPKIRIKLSAKTESAAEKKQTKKRKATPQKSAENGNSRKKPRRSPEGYGADDKEDEMFDVDTLQFEHDELDGTWEASRNFATKHGPWRLPESIESEFKEVAKLTLINLSKADEYDIFAEPVDESEVQGYYETITNPMDFSTMKSKVEKGEYGEGSDAAANLYEDFLLVFDNCYTFNDGGGEVVDEAALILKSMSLTFAKVCREVMRTK